MAPDPVTMSDNALLTSLHHARLFEGMADDVLPHVYADAEVLLGSSYMGNPDFELIQTQRFGVDDARALALRAAQMPLGGAQLFVLVATTLTVEAQNALLKLLEEPGQFTYFVLVVPSREQLLPTVRSRLEFSGLYRSVDAVDADVGAFLGADLGERLEYVKTLSEAKDKVRTRAFLDALEFRVYRAHNEQASAASRQFLTELAFVRTYIFDRSASVKMLLEHLALAVPRVT